MRKAALSLVTLLFLSQLASPAGARENGGSIAVTMKGFLAPSGAGAVLVGGEAVVLTAGPLYLGGAGYGGRLYASPEAGMGYGGMTLGFKRPLVEDTDFNFRLLMGGGGGVSNQVASGNLVLEPTLSLDTNLEDGGAVGLSAGYLFIPGVRDYSGATLGFRVTFKGHRKRHD